MVKEREKKEGGREREVTGKVRERKEKKRNTGRDLCLKKPTVASQYRDKMSTL